LAFQGIGVGQEELFPTLQYAIVFRGRGTHLGFALLFVVFILGFKMLNSTSVIDAIYIICSYTYGPLLGLFAFGLFTRWQVKDRAVPYIAIVSPVICFAIETITKQTTGYQFSYELLMLNGALTFIGLFLFRKQP